MRVRAKRCLTRFPLLPLGEGGSKSRMRVRAKRDTTDPSKLASHATPEPSPQPLSRRERGLLQQGIFAATEHDEDQPVHLHVADTDICAARCVEEYDNPCTRFCPAAVYEMVEDASMPHGKRLQVNAANCVHCKTCDIKDPYEIITWVTPEGGSGPNYQNL